MPNRVTDTPTTSTHTHVVVQSGAGLGRQTAADLAMQLSGSGAVNDRLSALEAGGILDLENVKAATTANVALTGAYTVDGVTLVDGDRYLAKDQTNAAQNGVRIYNSGGAHARATDMDTAGEVLSRVFVSGGTANAGKTFATTSTPATLDTDDIVFVLVADANSFSAALTAHEADTTNPHSVTAAQVGLGSVDNTTDAAKPVSTATQAALDLKAPLAGPTFTGAVDMTGATVTVPTQSADDDSTNAASTAYVDAAVAAGGGGSAYAPSPAYVTGDQTANITVSGSSSLLTGSGPWSNLVDGGTGSNYTDSITLGAVSVAGLEIVFDYGRGASRIVTEIKWKQSGTNTHGTWKLQGIKDGGDAEDIGSSFTLGGATEQTITAPSANTKGYRIYKLVGVSGTASGSPYIHEVEFKQDRDAADGATPDKFSIFHDYHGGAPSYYDDLIAAYLPLEDINGDTVYDQVGPYDIDLTGPTNPNVTRTATGLRTEAGLIQTPEIAGARRVFAFYRSKLEGSGGFIISGGTSSGAGIYEGGVSTAYTNRIAGFGHGFKAMTFRASNGLGAHETNRGVWAFASEDFGSAQDTILGFGGRHSTTTSRCDEYELLAAFVFDDPLTTAKETDLLWFMRQYAARLGIYFYNGDGPKNCYCLSQIGDSQADGRALYSAAPSTTADIIGLYAPFLHIMAGGAGEDHQVFSPLVPKVSQKLDSVITNGGKEQSHALEQSMAIYIGDNLEDFEYPVFDIKFGVGGSDLSSSSTGSATNGQDSWSPSELETSSLYYEWLAHHRRAMGLLMQDGYTVKKWVVAVYLGTNDMTSTSSAADDAAAEALVDDLLDDIKLECPSITPDFRWFRPDTGLSSEPGYDATAVSRIYNGITNAGTNRSDTTVISTDIATNNGDGTHFDGAEYIRQAALIAAALIA